ncbi:MAG TPA: hypothetical protein VMH79_04710 [Thermoanaerobaculia bacterium]|nr:hypothetical protein [Thermoanaerobaculia bacterium]
MGLTGFQLALVFAALLLGLIGAHLEYHGRVLGGQFSLFGWSMGLAGAGRALNLVSFLVLAYFGLKSMRMKRRIDRGNSGPRLRA